MNDLQSSNFQMARHVDRCLSNHHLVFESDEALLESWAAVRRRIAVLADLCRCENTTLMHAGLGRDNGLIGLTLEENLIQILQQLRDSTDSEGTTPPKASKLSPDEIRSLDDFDLLRHSENTLQYLRQHRPELPNLKTGKLGAFTDLQVAFALNIGALRTAIQDVKELPERRQKVLDELVLELEDNLDPLLEPYAEDHPEIHAEYLNARGKEVPAGTSRNTSTASRSGKVTEDVSLSG